MPSYPHPTWQSKTSRNRAIEFLLEEQRRIPQGRRLNVGSAAKRFQVKTVNLDLLKWENVDIQADVLNLPLRDECVDSIVCTGVLEHTCDPSQAVHEIHRVLKPGARAFFEVAFLQHIHSSPSDYFRWTPDGLRVLLEEFYIVNWHVIAGPASALAWQFQETMAMLFSLRSMFLYKVLGRIFGYMAMPIAWIDALLEQHPLAYRAASGFAAVVMKCSGQKGYDNEGSPA